MGHVDFWELRTWAGKMDRLIWTRGIMGVMLKAAVATVAVLLPLGLVWLMWQVADWIGG